MRIDSILQKIISNKLLSGSLVMTAGSLIAGFGNYLFHFLMGRMLGPADYGILEALISILNILLIPITTLMLVIVKYVSFYKGQERWGAIGKFYLRLHETALIVGTAGLIIFFVVVSPVLNLFLHLESFLALWLIGLIAFLGIFAGITKSFLQGLGRFFGYAIGSVSEVVVKISLAVAGVMIGWKTDGAVAAILAATIVGYLITRFLAKKEIILVGREEKLGRRAIIRYLLPVFLATLALSSLFAVDVILARHYFPDQEAGFYAALSTLGKIVFFVTAPLVAVMFPLVSERRAKGEDCSYILRQSAILVGLACGLITLLYFIFPNFIVETLYGKAFAEAASFLWIFTLFLSFYSLDNLFVNYFLSLQETRVVVFPLAAALGQIVLIIFYHQTYYQVGLISLSVGVLLFILLMLYYLRHEGKKPFPLSHCSCL